MLETNPLRFHLCPMDREAAKGVAVLFLETFYQAWCMEGREKNAAMPVSGLLIVMGKRADCYDPGHDIGSWLPGASTADDNKHARLRWE